MKLALQGVTVVAASGDSGVTAGGKCMGPSFDITLPTFLSCPYITLVGTTELTPGSSPGISERAVSRELFQDGASAMFSYSPAIRLLLPTHQLLFRFVSGLFC
jgi:tripeptidyl-peptidase-1